MDISFKNFHTNYAKLKYSWLAAASGGQMANKPMFQRPSLSSSTAKVYWPLQPPDIPVSLTIFY
jgi:hypothetical protein